MEIHHHKKKKKSLKKDKKQLHHLELTGGIRYVLEPLAAEGEGRIS